MSDDQPYAKDDEKRTNATMIRGTTHGGGSVHDEGTDGSEVSSSVAKKLDGTATDIVERLLPVPDRLAKEALDEIKRLRSSMAEQRFCEPPVAGSSPAVGSLTDEERKAIAYYVGTGGPDAVDATLRALLERTK